MKLRTTLFLAVSCVVATSVACGGGQQQPSQEQSVSTVAMADNGEPAIIDHKVESLSGETVDLASFRGKPMLIVNTASKCGYTPQYESLQKLYEKYDEGDLLVIGFPSNDFKQEPGSAEEIESFCRLNYGVTFPMMAKVHVKGDAQAPVYRTLTADSGEDFRGEVRWNFTKFLVDQEGRVVARFEPSVDPMDEQVTSAVEVLLESPEG